MQETHTMKINIFHNLHYFFACGYDVDNPNNTFPVANPEYHKPNIPRDKAHIYENHGASMVEHHRSIPDETGAGMGWIISNRISKAQFIIKNHQEFEMIHKQKHY